LIVENSNSTGAAPLSSATFYFQQTPSGVSVPGQIIASDTFVLTDTPNPITAQDDTSGFGFSQQSGSGEAAPLLSAGETFTCSLFGGTTLLGSATANADASTSNGTTTSSAACEASYGGTNPGLNYTAFLALNNGSIAPGESYTWVISH
jgi:hypothetical protein